MVAMTPSRSKKMTTDQVDKAADLFRVAVRKHRTEFDSDAAQAALGNPELGAKLLAVFRQFVEAVSNMIARRVRVNRTRTPQEALDATGCTQYTNRKVVDSVPRGEGDKVEVVFFKPDLSERDGYISDDDLQKEYDLRGFRPADLYEIAAVNEADPAFADEHPNGTHWKDADGKWCFATFNGWRGERSVRVDRNDGVWYGYWSWAGVRK